jgi:hypothetical protein
MNEPLNPLNPTHDALERIIWALERIAAALEPSENRDERSFHDLVTDVAELLTEDSQQGALATISSCASDISTALSGGDPPDTTIADSLETIANTARAKL